MTVVKDLGAVIVLAGQRPGPDALCEATQQTYKALIPILGTPMINYPLKTLSSVTPAPIFVSGLDIALINPQFQVLQAPSGQGPADSALLAADAARAYPMLITTADHALLTPEMIKAFVAGAVETGADFCVGLAERAVIEARYPQTRRTYLRFRGQPVSGCNLFYVANEKGLAALSFWRTAQQDRKRPIKLASRIGVKPLIAYLFKRLTLDGAFEYASKTLKINACPVLIPIADAAIDVDKVKDLEDVTVILSQRATGRT